MSGTVHFKFSTVRNLIDQGILFPPLDGNHGEIHPTTADYVSSGIPFIMASDIDNGRIDYVGCKFISRKHADTLRKGFAKNGDVLLTHKATIGKTAVVNYADEPYVMLTPQVTYYRVKNPEQLNNLYLRYFFDSSFFQQLLHLWAGSGSTRAYLGITEQAKLPIVVPPIETQKKIAAILSTYDDLIANNQRRITLLERMAEDIYREWFVRLHFPGHENVKVEKGVPQGWKLVTLEKAFKFYGGATPARDTPRFWKDGTVNWFTPTDITAAKGMFVEESSEQCTDEGLENCSSKLFPPYSVMLTSRATIGAIGINLTPACTNQGFITCIPNDAYPLAYLYHWLKLGKPHFESLSGGSTFAELTKGTFKRMEILTPPEPLVKQFGQLCSPLLQSIEAMLKANASLKATRDSLLPRLISGRLAVDALDIRFPPRMPVSD